MTFKYTRYIPVHKINSALGPRRAACLPFFYTFTDCFKGYGKKTLFNAFMENEDFIDITSDLLEIKDISEIEELPKQIETSVSFLYDKNQTNETVRIVKSIIAIVHYN